LRKTGRNRKEPPPFPGLKFEIKKDPGKQKGGSGPKGEPRGVGDPADAGGAGQKKIRPSGTS